MGHVLEESESIADGVATYEEYACYREQSVYPLFRDICYPHCKLLTTRSMGLEEIQIWRAWTCAYRATSGASRWDKGATCDIYQRLMQ